MAENKNICVFLSANDVSPDYETPALELVSLIARNKDGFVYGGSERGLMKKAADLTRREKGRIVSVVSEEFRAVWRTDVDECIECPDIPVRKKRILEVSDAVVVLPGGTGTLDELMEAVETKKWGAHNKPIVLLNTKGYWNGLLTQIETMTKEGFFNKPLFDLIYVTEDPQDAMNYINREFDRKTEDK
jgi:uncharacterized protein (TIGR00730 family)